MESLAVFTDASPVLDSSNAFAIHVSLSHVATSRSALQGVAHVSGVDGDALASWAIATKQHAAIRSVNARRDTTGVFFLALLKGE